MGRDDSEFVLPGKSLAYTRVDFTNESGDLVAYGSEFLCLSQCTYRP